VISEQQAWLEAAARVPLLTQQEEIIMGRQVQAAAGIDPQSNRPEDLAILRRAHRARERLATANLRLVYRIAQRYRRAVPASGFMDLLQAGAEGVMRAAGKFDPANGSKFSTYSAWWIRERIQDELAKTSRTIRAPTTITGKLRRLPGIRQSLTMKLGRSPTVEELAAESKLSTKEVIIELERARGLVSLDSWTGKTSANIRRPCGVTLGDMQATPVEDDDDQLDLLRQGMEQLPDTERRLLEAAYLPGGPTLTQQARVEGVSIRRARELVESGMQRLRMLQEVPQPQHPQQLHLPLQLFQRSIHQRSRSAYRRRRRCYNWHQLELDLAA
jgi:RNA polymerase primary sigma factor